MFLCPFLHVTLICRAGFVINGPRELIEKFSFSIFWKNLWSTDKIYSLSVWYNSPVKHHFGFRLLCIFLESSSKLSNLLILVVCNIPFNFNFCQYVPSFVSNFGNLCLLFFSWSVLLMFVHLKNISRESTFSLVDFSIVFLFSISLICTQIEVVPSFCWIWILFALLFLLSQGRSLGYCFRIFLLF